MNYRGSCLVSSFNNPLAYLYITDSDPIMKHLPKSPIHVPEGGAISGQSIQEGTSMHALPHH